MSYPNEHIDTFAGTAGTAYTLGVSKQYTTNLITISGVSSGIITVRAKERGSNTFEKVQNGTISLSDNERTLRISGYQITEFEFKVSDTAAFTVAITQSNPIIISA